MKVIYEHDEEVCLGNISVGQCFRFDRQLYMRIKTTINISASCWIHCVNIETGELITLAPTLHVAPIEVQVHILRG